MSEPEVDTPATLPTMAVSRDRYEGWIDVVRRERSTLDSYRTESIVDFGNGWAELRRFSWSQPLASTWHTGERCYCLVLVLDGGMPEERRNAAAAQVSLYGGRRVQLIPPDQTVRSVTTGGGEARSMRCFIDAAFVEAICRERPTREERALLGTLDFGGGTIEWLLHRMYREIGSCEVGVAVAVEGIAREIAVHIARTLERHRPDGQRRCGGLPPWRLRLVLERIHADQPLPRRAELADLCGLTVRHLNRAFKIETGKTIGEVVAAAMAERADTMLKAGMPSGAVAASLGYASCSSFAHAFRRETGIPPSDATTQLRPAGTSRAVHA